MTESIIAGGLEFFLEARRSGDDGGPTLRVHGMVDGKSVQLLRFDMFRVQPHYHYDPSGADTRYDLDPLAIDDGIGWAIGLLIRRLPDMLTKAGYDQILASVDVASAIAGLPQIEQRWRAINQTPVAP